MKLNFFIRFVSLAMVLFGSMYVVPTGGAVVSSYQLFKDQSFFQATALEPTPQGTDPYSFFALVRSTSPGQILSAQIQAPGSLTYNLVVDGSQALWSAPFATSSALDLAYPAGAYTVTITTAADGVFSANLSIGALGYPPTPRMHMPAQGLTVSTNAPLLLEWDSFTAGGSSDAIQVTVENVLGRVIFRTADPGTTGALRASATSVSIPAATWSPDPSLPDAAFTVKVRFVSVTATNTTSYPGASGCAGFSKTTSALAFVSTKPALSDLFRYGVFLGRRYTQSESNSPALASTSGFLLEAGAVASGAGKLVNADVRPVGGTTRTLMASTNRVDFLYADARDTLSSFQGVYPVGPYAFSFDCANDGSQSALLTLAGDPPPAPYLINLKDAQYVDASFPFAIAWDTWTNNGLDDFIQLTILDANGRVILASPDWRSSLSPIDPSDREFEIPENTLSSNQTYQVRLRFQAQSTVDSAQYPNAVGHAGAFSETWFTLGTYPAPPPPFLITSASNLAEVAIGQELNWYFSSVNGQPPYAWSLVSGSIPGLSVDPSAGILTGWPSVTGTFGARVRVVEGRGRSAEQLFSLSVTGTPLPLVLGTTNLIPALGGVFYEAELWADGGVPPYRWSVPTGSLPPGFTLNETNGLLLGTPTQSGSFTINLHVQDSAGQGESRSLALDIPAFDPPPVHFLELVRTNGATTSLRAPVDPEQVFTVEASSDLQTWRPLLSTNRLNEGVALLDSGTRPTIFYRTCYGYPEPPPNPLAVTVWLEETNMANALDLLSYPTNSPFSLTAIVSSSGGVLSLTNPAGAIYSLNIPSNAMVWPEPVGMSLVRSVEGLPFDQGLFGAVQFAPENLLLLKPATLTITLPQPLGSNVTGFAFGEGGADFHLYPHSHTNNTLTFLVSHFSGVGAGGASPQNVQAQKARNPCAAAANAIQQLFSGKLTDMPKDEDIVTALRKWFENSVRPQAKEAEGNESMLHSAVREYLQWLRAAELLILGHVPDGGPMAQVLNALNETARRSLARGYINAMNKTHARAVNENKPFEAFNLLRYAKEAQLLDFQEYYPSYFSWDAISDRIHRTVRFRLDFVSVISGRTENGYMTTAIKNSTNAILQIDKELLYWEQRAATLEAESFTMTSPKLPYRLQKLKGTFNIYYVKITREHEKPETRCFHAPSGATDKYTIVLGYGVDMPSNLVQVLDPLRGWVALGDGVWDLPYAEFHKQEIHHNLPGLNGENVSGIVVQPGKWERAGGGKDFARAHYDGPRKFGDATFVEATELHLYFEPKPLRKRDQTVPR